LAASIPEVIAVRLVQSVAANSFPVDGEWARARPVAFCHDWQGKNPDPQRNTEVRLLWAADALFVRFRCSYRTLNVLSDSRSDGRRDQLWDRDVAEVFLQPDHFGEKYYKEFEISPHGQWLDLDISPQGLQHIASGMQSRVVLDEQRHEWCAELAIPMNALTTEFHPEQSWRVNFFRCEGIDPERHYSSWQPTCTPGPNFHVPEKFGTLRFVDSLLSHDELGNRL